MIFVFFIYGLAFFILGFSIYLYPKKSSMLLLAKHLWLIGVFGILHGLNEWIDMFILIQVPLDIGFLNNARFFILPASFLFLLLFGVRTLIETNKKYQLLKVLPVGLPLLWVVFALISHDRNISGDIWARYLLAVPGTMLTCLALTTHFPEMKRTNAPMPLGSLRMAANAFFLYGILAGLVVKQGSFFPASVLNYSSFTNAVGVPVQILRAGCAVLVAVCMVRILRVFDWEARRTLRNSEERYRTLAEAARDAIFVIDREDRFSYINHFGAGLFGLSPGDVIGKSRSALFPDLSGDLRNKLDEVSATGTPVYLEEKAPVPSGDLWLSTLFVPLKNESGAVTSMMGIARDITSQKHLEEQLRQSHKMQAIGQIAAGIAHDFNNILSVIMGHSEFLQMDIQESDLLRPHVDQILASTELASHLTRGLLTFSRKQVVKSQPTEIRGVIENVEKLLHRLIGKDIEIRIRLAPGNSIIMADAGQIEQVLMNLAMNARDAMPDGGTLTIETGRVDIDSEFIRVNGYGSLGKFVHLSVLDTGMGMDAGTKEKVFDPFFTTKEVGKGTGLGLAIVYGIVQQHNGHIHVSSEPGLGTNVKVFFRLIDTPDTASAPSKPAASCSSALERTLSS